MEEVRNLSKVILPLVTENPSCVLPSRMMHGRGQGGPRSGAATRPQGMGSSRESRTQAGPKACECPLVQEEVQVPGADLSLRSPTAAPSGSKMTGWDDILRTVWGVG